MWRRVQRFACAIAIVSAPGLASAVKPVHGDTWHLTVRGGDIDLRETPLLLELKEAMAPGIYTARPPSSGEPAFTAQVFDDSGGPRLGVVLPRVDAHRDVTFTLVGPPESAGVIEPGITFATQGNKLEIKLNHELVTAYQLGVGNKPFFFPMIGPTGESYTRAFPMQNVMGEDRDHPHQRSCWFTFGKVNDIDFWSEGERTGKIRETGRKLIVAGPVVGRLTTTNEWRAPDDRRFCVDERTMTFYRTKTARIIDFDFRISATDGPVSFGDTKEGMFGIRVASSMDVNKKKGGRITNAEGLTDDKAWGKPSAWVDYVGPVKDQLVGIAIVNHPRSFRFPTTWHVRTYGLFAANPFGWHDFGRTERGDYTIPNGHAIAFSYRVILHEGDTPSANVSAHSTAYTRPPVLEIRKD